MNNKLLAVGLAIVTSFFLSGCGEDKSPQDNTTIAARAYRANLDADMKSNGNWLAKRFGGSAHITLPPNHKLVSLSWKQDDLWVLYRPFREGEKPEHYIYKEDSKFGLVEGTVIIKEEATNGSHAWIDRTANDRGLQARQGLLPQERN